MVTILSAALADGIDAVEAAAAEALKLDLTGAEVVLNILARSRAGADGAQHRDAGPAQADDRTQG